MLFAIVFLPLVSAIFVGLFSNKVSDVFAQYFSSLLLVISAVLSWVLFIDIYQNGDNYTYYLFRWIDIASFKANWVLKADILTAVMFVVVNTVSALVHIYSIGYMHHDSHVPRFMSYLSLFTFFMLMLVSSDNLIQLFFGWEGVGLCSYLLVGFWYHKESANNAAMKAFIVNRVADFAFVIGIATIYFAFNTIQFQEIFEKIQMKSADQIHIFGHQLHLITVIGVLLFIGAMGKSAQIGLHVWLPDAMEGPTPVSALIHAATMVTAGVFLVARFSHLYEYSEFARDMITYVGAITAIFAATIAMLQTDIKKIIAYSTCSQLGYMFFACGVSAYGAAIFHLFTHAFFKALLFLGAGSVIHALNDEQNIKKMGGLWKKIPYTYVMMFVGSLALSGIYPFAGFFSKDAILEAAYATKTEAGHFAYWIGIVAAFMTAFYSWRLLILVFHRKTHLSSESYKNAHESPLIMLLPLFILSVGAVCSGYLGEEIGVINGEITFWQKAILMIAEPNIMVRAHHIEYIYKLLPLIAGVVGIFSAYILYIFIPSVTEKLIIIFRYFYKLVLNKWYFDEIYNKVLVEPLKKLSLFVWVTIDQKYIDGIGPNGVAFITSSLSKIYSKAQSGFVFHYVLVMTLGVVMIITWFVLKLL